MSDEMVFEQDLTPVVIPITIGKKNYVLHEADEGAGRQYKNCLTRCTRFTDGKPAYVDGVHDAESLLVSLCLFELYGDPNKPPLSERPVILSQVLKFKPSTVAALYKKALEISDLKAPGTQEDKSAKKDLTAGTDASSSPATSESTSTS